MGGTGAGLRCWALLCKVRKADLVWGGAGLETSVRRLLHQSWRGRWGRTARVQRFLTACSAPGLDETPLKRRKKIQEMYGIEFLVAEICNLLQMLAFKVIEP